ncbi:MAG TPA: ABC transporter ATP-binding protein, partial [Aquiluna sp.]
SLAELRSHGQTRLILKVDQIDEAVDILKTQGIGKIKFSKENMIAPVAEDLDVAKINEVLVKKKIKVSEIRLEHPSLEEYFVDLTGEGFEVVR